MRKMYRFIYSDGCSPWHLYKGEESDKWIAEILDLFKTARVEWEEA